MVSTFANHEKAAKVLAHFAVSLIHCGIAGPISDARC